jgi:hypothetical protein
MTKSTFNFSGIFLALVFFAGAAQAQATRTWVSGVGDDANPCSRTAPCKTFAGAISKTTAAGEISVLDPGVFGAVTITKSMTIDGQGQLSSITYASSTNGITINAGANDIVIVRNISLDGVGSGGDGIRLLNAGQLIVDGVTISGGTQFGIDVLTGTSARVVVSNTSISQGMAGVKLATGNVSALLDRVSIRGTTTGVDAVSGTVEIVNSVIAQNTSFGVYAEGGTIDVETSMLTGNGVAVQSQTGSLVRISNSDLYNNGAGFGCGGGAIASAQNNRKGGNTGGTAPVCAPNATIALQ